MRGNQTDAGSDGGHGHACQGSSPPASAWASACFCSCTSFFCTALTVAGRGLPAARPLDSSTALAIRCCSLPARSAACCAAPSLSLSSFRRCTSSSRCRFSCSSAANLAASSEKRTGQRQQAAQPSSSTSKAKALEG